ncbi:MAG: helix-turn-helix transcriptional regulator [Pseudomonadota bacterium]
MAAPRARSEPTVDFGALLRDWRRHRQISQLALSAASGISQRHISFLENGRARPSQGMVVALADALDVPLRERNTLLISAGYSANYATQALQGGQLAVFRQAIDALLAQQEPYPAIVLDGRWNLVQLNAGATRFFGNFIELPAPQSPATGDFQLVHLCLQDEGLRPALINWEEVVHAFLQRARRALLVNPRDRALGALVEMILHHPDAPERWHTPDWDGEPAPAITLRLEDGGERFELLTMHAHFAGSQQVSLEELTVELFFPANAHTAAWFAAPPTD